MGDWEYIFTGENSLDPSMEWYIDYNKETGEYRVMLFKGFDIIAEKTFSQYKEEVPKVENSLM